MGVKYPLHDLRTSVIGGQGPSVPFVYPSGLSESRRREVSEEKGGTLLSRGLVFGYLYALTLFPDL